jgi:hypothetical protein
VRQRKGIDRARSHIVILGCEFEGRFGSFRDLACSTGAGNPAAASDLCRLKVTWCEPGLLGRNFDAVDRSGMRYDCPAVARRLPKIISIYPNILRELARALKRSGNKLRKFMYNSQPASDLACRQKEMYTDENIEIATRRTYGVARSDLPG